MGRISASLVWMICLVCLKQGVHGWCSSCGIFRLQPLTRTRALSSDYLENDLVAVRPPEPPNSPPRLCVVRPDGSVSPLCRHEDDVETDLFADPRSTSNVVDRLWQELTDEDILGTYGEGWYGQRPVPSLGGGGAGYGAEADEIWSVSEEVLEQLASEGVDVPVLDVGISHGEKARRGAY